MMKALFCVAVVRESNKWRPDFLQSTKEAQRDLVPHRFYSMLPIRLILEVRRACRTNLCFLGCLYTDIHSGSVCPKECHSSW